jgi:hypothetical protein
VDATGRPIALATVEDGCVAIAKQFDPEALCLALRDRETGRVRHVRDPAPHAQPASEWNYLTGGPTP